MVAFARINYVPPDGGEKIENGALHVRIVEHGENTSHRVGLTEVRLDAGAQGPPQHYHLAHEETFYVVSGLIRFTSGNDTIDAGPGGLLTAPLRAPHSFANPDPDEPAVLFITYTPDLYVKYFQEMGELGLEGKQITDEDDIKIMSGYETYPYPPKD